MDKQKEEFLEQLRETFRSESAEHLEDITAGLLTFERASAAERALIVERILREAHSLKGAARSVSLAGVEALCMELESVFSAMKRDELSVSTEMLDSLHPTLGVLAALCRRPGAPPLPGDKEREEQALAVLKGIVRGTPDKRAVTPTVAFADPLPVVSPPHVEATAAPDTVRVSSQKLGAILLEAEELVGARIAGNGHASELRLLAKD